MSTMPKQEELVSKATALLLEAERFDAPFASVHIDLLRALRDAVEFGEPVERKPCGCVEGADRQVLFCVCDEHVKPFTTRQPRKLARD